MFFVHLFCLLASKTPRHNNQTRFIEQLSLIPPHVGANGREDYFDFDNHFVIKAMTRRDFTQLGYKDKNSYGMIKTKENFKFKEMEIMFDFTLHDVSKGGKNAGFGLWLTQEAKNNPEFYGGARDFDGCGVIVDIEGTPYIRYVDSKAKTLAKGVPIASTNETFRVAFSTQDKKFSVKLFVSDKEHVLYEGPVVLPEKVYLSCTSFSGTSRATMHLERIFSNAYVKVSKQVPVARGERKGSKIGIYLLGVATIIGLLYYIYSKETKEFSMKN